MVICSRCGQEGHTRRSASCPQVAMQPIQQPIQQTIQHAGIIYGFGYCVETFVELNSDLYDRVLIHNTHFMREFIEQIDDNEDNDDKRVFLIRLNSIDGTKSIVVNVGGGHREYDTEAIYAPSWILQALNIMNDAPIFWEKVAEPPPRATKISLKPIDPLMNDVDGREEIEYYLKNCNVLQEGINIQVPLRLFDNYLATVYVEKLEPGPIVLLRNEVELELLENAIQPISESQPTLRLPTPIPEEPQLIGMNDMPQQNTLVMPQQQLDQATRRKLMADAAERRLVAITANQS